MRTQIVDSQRVLGYKVIKERLAGCASNGVLRLLSGTAEVQRASEELRIPALPFTAVKFGEY